MSKAHLNRTAPAAHIADKGWSLRRTAAVEILTADVLTAFPWIVHGFSTRKGGVSRCGRAAVLNLGFTEWDSPRAVNKNREAFLRSVWDSRRAAKTPRRARTEPSLITLRQVHSDVLQLISKAPPQPPSGDAALCRRAGLLLAIQTADCVPILMADPAHRLIAAVHAGWRGTLARVLAKTIGRMRLEFGTRPQDIIAAIGPAIGPCCYEVGPEVAQAFLGQFACAAEWFEGPFDRLATGEEPNPLPWLTMMPPGHEPPPERVRLDLRAANRWQLTDAGVNPRNIAVSTLCTGCRSDLFFSYRKQGAAAGRMMSVIGICATSR